MMWSTLLSWAALLAVAVGLTHYYNPDLLRRWRQPATVPDAKQPKKKSKRTHLSGEEKGTSTPASSNEAPISKKRKIVSAPLEATVKVTTKGNKTSVPRDDDGEMSNRDFAQQLAKAQAGTNFEKNTAPQKDRRTVKAGKAVESPSLSAETSSTGGRDGDDDMSPVGSPPSGPVSTAPTSRAGDVSDMLEAPAAKPTTLRLTDIPETKPKQAPKQFEPALTKKQRQRKARQEENRQLREQADRVQEAKKEQQLRTARMAAGTSNQTKAISFTPTQNAWKQDPAPSQPTGLLDTFDPSETPKANGQAVTTQPLSNITNGVNMNVNAVKADIGENKTRALAASTRERPELSRGASWADEVNEEEQSRWEKELVQEEQWESVTSKKTKKKMKKDTDTSSEASSSLARPKQNGVQANGFRAESLNRFQSMERVGGSDWEA